jgi:hypothetical protein
VLLGELVLLLPPEQVEQALLLPMAFLQLKNGRMRRYHRLSSAGNQ